MLSISTGSALYCFFFFFFFLEDCWCGDIFFPSLPFLYLSFGLNDHWHGSLLTYCFLGVQLCIGLVFHSLNSNFYVFQSSLPVDLDKSFAQDIFSSKYRAASGKDFMVISCFLQSSLALPF